MDESVSNVVEPASSELGSTARVLATTGSVVLYGFLWTVAVAAGVLLVGLAGAGALIGVFFFVSRRVDRAWPKTLLRDSAIALLAGAVISLLNMMSVMSLLGVGTVTVDIVVVAVGGLVNGFVRRRFFFARIFESPLIKIAVVLIIILPMFGMLAISLAVISQRITVPEQLLTPATIPEGWEAREIAGLVNLFYSKNEYVKGKSIFTISAQRFPEPAKTSAEYGQIAEFTMKMAVMASGSGGRTTSTQLAEPSESPISGGGSRHTYRYRIAKSGPTSFPRIDLSFHFYHCPDPGTTVDIVVMIKEEPFDELALEAEQMVRTLRCLTDEQPVDID